MFFKRKNEKGVLEIDFATGMILFMISSAAIITMYANIYTLMVKLKVNQVMIGYITEICEEIDAENYTDLTQDRVNKIISSCNIPRQYSVTSSITKYTSINKSAKDVVEKINIDVSYKVGNQNMKYTVYKVKIKEK